MSVVDAGAEQLSSMRAAVAPVIDALRRDPLERPLLDHVLSAAASHPGVDAPDVPAQCRQPGADDEEVLPAAGSALPDGVYRTAITVAAVSRAGVSNGPGWSGTWTLEVRGGTFTLVCRPLDEPGTDCGGTVSDKPLEAGRLHGGGDEVTFAFDEELLSALSGCRLPPSTSLQGHCVPLDPYGGKWTMEGDRLTFRDVRGQGHHLGIEPWQRID
jgi:hypothetical protein